MISNLIEFKYAMCYNQRKGNKRRIIMSNQDFTIVDGVLEKYTGSDTVVEIPDSVTSIGSRAFVYCRTLTSVTIPNSVTSIGDWAFFECKKITSITIGDNVTSIGNNAFCSCKSLTNVTIPNSVTSIGAEAFKFCTSLTSVTISDSVTSIGNSAFDHCNSLTGITVDNNNQYYSSDEYGVLFNKDKTTLIQYPKGNARTSYTIPDSVTSIGGFVFYNCTDLTSVTIGENVTSIGKSAFWKCESLKEILIPNSVTSIEDEAFYGCKNLKEIFIPDSVKTIGKLAFHTCESLEKIKLPKGLKTISGYMLTGCKSLTEIVIPEKVKKIDACAFSACYSIKNITIPNGVTSLGSSAFSGCPLEELDIPASVTKIDGLRLGYDNIKRIIIRADSAKVSKELFYRDWTSEKSKEMLEYYKDTIEKFKSVPPVEIYCTLKTKATMPKNLQAACIDIGRLDGSSEYVEPEIINIYKINDKFLADQIIDGKDLDEAFENYEPPKNKLFKITNGAKEIKVKTKFGNSLRKFKQEFEYAINIFDMYVADEYLLSKEDVLAKIEEIDPNHGSDAFRYAAPEIDYIHAPSLDDESLKRRYLIMGYIAEKLLDKAVIEKLVEEMPKKKDGSFAKNKVLRIASSRIAQYPCEILEIFAKADGDDSFVVTADFRKFSHEEVALLEIDFITRNSNILGLKFE